MKHVYPKGFGNPPNLLTAREFIAACQQEQADLRERIKAQVEQDGGLSLDVDTVFPMEP